VTIPPASARPGAAPATRPTTDPPAPIRPPLRPVTIPPGLRPARPQAAALPAGMDPAAMQELYRKYVQAKRSVGENPDAVRYEQLVQTVARTAPKILEEHKAKGVDFDVVVKDNKVILKAIPKK
jgi:hypothetical protein